MNIRGIFLQREYKRYYPEGEKLAHVIGFTNRENRPMEGVELIHNRDMTGTSGQEKIIRDKLGNPVRADQLVAPTNGQDVQLTIDKTIQFFTYQTIKNTVEKYQAKGGSAVVVDAKTGEVLAMANWPSYDPNALFSHGESARISVSQLRNRAMVDAFEPGSVMKPISIALALDAGLVTPQTQINTAPGKKKIGNFTISDAHPFGQLSVAQIVQKSSNVGTVAVIEKLPKKTLWEGLQQFGFGQIPQTQFPGTTAGRLRSYKKWGHIDKLSIGYDIATAIDAKPMTPVGVAVISPETAAHVRKMLELVTAPTGGTAPQAQVMGYRVGGKTGTVRKFVHGQYSQKAYRSVFVGMAPMSQPRIVVAVMIDEPSNGQYYAGEVAAPAFSQISEQTLRILNVPVDSAIKSLVVGEYLMTTPIKIQAADTPQEVIALMSVLGRSKQNARLSCDSRKIQAGDVFVALTVKGVDGRAHMTQALTQKASVILAEAQGFSDWQTQLGWTTTSGGETPVVIVVDQLAQQLGAIAKLWFQSEALPKIIGITGTNGKTTSCLWLCEGLRQLGQKTASIGTLGIGVDGHFVSTGYTTPDALLLQSIFADLAKAQVETIVMEVSSHALDQGRVNAVSYETALLTNFSQDHLDYHTDLDDYWRSKAQLFAWPNLKNAVLNRQDARRVFASCLTMGYTVKACLDVLQVIASVPGRMQVINHLHKNQPLVVVDFAHTPDAVRKVLMAIRPQTKLRGGRLWCIFGCGGNRDASKRPLMGQAAASCADQLVITSDNPRQEDPDHIIADIVQGLGATQATVVIEPDRAKAIAYAIGQAQPNDVIVLAGKGHETTQDIAGRKLPFNDAFIAQQVLEAHYPTNGGNHV
ncbi:unnamed protein product, partial [Darwinula stevensoni]